MSRHCFRLFIAILMLVNPAMPVLDVSATPAVQEAALTPLAGEPHFVVIAPCRILDSAAGRDAGQKVRAVDLISTRCGRIIPPYATKYSVRITAIPRLVPGQVVPGTSPAQVTTLKIPTQSGRPLNFDVPDGFHIGVDVDGYYVSPGTPVSPVVATAVTGSASESASAPSPFRQPPGSHSVYDGSAGNVYLNASQLPHTGVLMTAAAGSPWIAAKTGTNTAGSGFAVINSSNTELMRVRGDGAVQLTAGAFFDGRIDYFGSPGSYYGYVSVPGNVINDVTLINPTDASGGTANRVVFFRARTDDENGSPPTTKFEAFTMGYYGQQNVNFDSKIRYHWPGVGQYYYRAMGVEYQNSAFVDKPTFWVKADTNGDAYTNTRADVYVSGRVGIGTTTPGTILHLMKSAPAAIGPEIKLENSGASVGDKSAITFADNAVDRAQIRSTIESNPWPGTLEFHTGFGTLTERMRITGAGTVGIGTAAPNPAYILDVNGNVNVSGNIGAKYQDLAEWVPSTEALAAGTVVVLDPARANHVLASARAYDTSVAGVVSAKPGIILGEAGESKAMVATTGRVRVRVDASKHAVAIGDLLVTGDKPGVAMKSMPIDVQGIAIHRPGTVVGKALESLTQGEGDILVLLSLQ